MFRSDGYCLELALALYLALVASTCVVAQAQSSRPDGKASSSAASPASPSDVEATREELIRILRMSPKLTSVVARDPSLLADEAYVTRNNPELAQFLRNHAEVVRNPEFYLFFNLGRGPKQLRLDPEMRLQSAVWPELVGFPERESLIARRMSEILAFLVFVCILAALLWISRMLLENSRWKRLFKIQSDLYSKLLDKCSTNEELLALIHTEAGKPFLESVAVPLGLEARAANPMNRVFMPLQLGIVLTLAGAGFIYLRNSVPDDPTPFLVLGTLAFTLGIGFVISAVVSFALARHLGLLPQTAGPAAGAKLGSSN
ncbi:MAG: hypothetical protein DMF60_17965 [Acidobacteria bacterium]|nr:MAG: hypothetical protein DMF60_17965 [Acidobacteriota bacterium]